MTVTLVGTLLQWMARPLRIQRPNGRYHVTARGNERQLGELAGGVDYAAVAQAVSRFGKRLAREGELRRTITALDD